MPSRFFERLTPEHSKLIATMCRFLLPLIISIVSIVMLVAACWILRYAGTEPTDSGFLVNVAAGFVEIAIGIVTASIIAAILTKRKFRQLSRPVLTLIQRLRIDGRLTKEQARHAVVFAVAVLSENNVSRAIRSRLPGSRIECPICAQRVKERMNKCSFCKLPKAIWNDQKLVKVHMNIPKKNN